MAPPDAHAGSVHVIGASGRSGAALCRALRARGQDFVPVVRDAGRWTASGLEGSPRIADLEDATSLSAALADARAVVSTAHARHAGKVIAAAPAAARLVFLGSTRKFTRWPDDHGNGVIAGERALLESGRSGVMLHPTMIYGAQGENNVQRLAALLRRLPLVPLPGGGSSLVQPIHQDDVTRAILASLDRDWDGSHGLVIAGAEAMTYRAFMDCVALAAGVPVRRVINVPTSLLLALSPILPAAVRRLMEDRAFDIAPMRALLGFQPMLFLEGLSKIPGLCPGPARA